MTNKIIKKFGKPIAAPSANKSGKPSGTKIEDIKERKALLEKTTIELSNLPHGSKKVQDTQSESLAEVMDLTKDLEVYIKRIKRKNYLN